MNTLLSQLPDLISLEGEFIKILLTAFGVVFTWFLWGIKSDVKDIRNEVKEIKQDNKEWRDEVGEHIRSLELDNVKIKTKLNIPE